MGLVDLLFPKQCLNCKLQGGYVCIDCLNKLPQLRQVCPECGKPSVDGMTHIGCARPWGLDGLIFLWPYGGVIRKSILGLKYGYAAEIAKELAEHSVFYLRKKRVALPLESTLVPIPLYWLRENWRGFNQADVIGKLMVGRMKWDFQPDLLVRKRLKKPQTDLKKDERAENIRGVFALNPNYKLLATNYILFDDVFTTGATMKEAAKVLKRNGAKKVWGLTIAR